MGKVKLIDIINRRDKLEDRINSLNHLKRNDALKAFPGVEEQFYTEVKQEWEKELATIDSILNKDCDVKQIESFCQELATDGNIRVFPIKELNCGCNNGEERGGSNG
jgi:redox-regulated HSP33 family molecular chaperone